MFREGDQLGPYTLVSKIGSGAFGTVWLADRRTPIATTRVALKVPSGDEVDLEAIKQEANLWVQASGHPNVVPIIEANVYNEQVVIASEFIAEGSLEDWLIKNGGKAPSLESAVEMACGILSGLEHLHSRHIIHRDLKPANLLIQGQTPRLADFGISRILKNTSRSMLAAGTPSYMAPEAFDGKRNEQTDLWSVGVMLYQMLVGRLPFPQTDMTSLIGAIVARNPDPLPISVPAPLQAAMNCALAKNPAQRYRTAGEMRSALRNALDQIRQGKAQPALQPFADPSARATTPQPPAPFTNPAGPARPAPTAPTMPMTPPPPQYHQPAFQPAYQPGYQPGYQPMTQRGTSPLVYVLAALIAVLVVGGGIFAFIMLRSDSSGPTANSNSALAVTTNNNSNLALANSNTAPTPDRNNSNRLPVTPVDPGDPNENLYKHAGAGIQFEKPEGWDTTGEGDQLTITAPDKTVSMVFWVVDQSNLQTAANAIDAELEKVMTNPRPDGPVSSNMLNGMTVFTQTGKGEVNGATLEWSSHVIMANKPVLVVTFAAPGLYEKHNPEIERFVRSIRRMSSTP